MWVGPSRERATDGRPGVAAKTKGWGLTVAPTLFRKEDVTLDAQ